MRVLFHVCYFPPIGLLTSILNSRHLVIEAHEHYQKGSFRNRTLIRGANGQIALSVPLEKGKHQSTPITAVRIDYDQDWQRQHWRSIQSAYGSAPFFEHYASGLKSLLETRYPTLFELDQATLKWVLENLKLEVTVAMTDAFNPPETTHEDDLRMLLTPKKKRSDHESALDQSIRYYENVFDYEVPSISKLSSLDLLMHLGPEWQWLIQ